MAGRVNTRFVIILAVSMVVLVGVIVAAKWYTGRHDPARYMAQAEELLNSHEYEKAALAMNRAYNYEKETAKRVSIRMKMAEVLQQVPAPTTIKARDLLGQVEAYWRQVVDLEPSNVEASQKLLNLYYRRAELFPQYIQLWTQLFTASEDLLKYTPDNVIARRYRGLAQVMRIGSLNLGEEAITAAEADLQAALASNPKDARVAVALATLDMNVSEEAARVNNAPKARELQKKAVTLIDQFLKANPDNAEALMGRFQTQVRIAMRNKDEQAIKSAMEILDQVETLLLKADQPEQTRQLADRLAMRDTKTIKLADGTEVRSGLYRAEQLLRHVVSAHTDDVASLLSLGTILQRQQRWEDALSFFKLARKDRAMPVRVEALQANEYRQQAAKNIVDIHVILHELAKTPEDKKKEYDLANQELAVLRSISGETSPLLTLMEGKIALATGNGREAIAKLEKVNTQSEGRNPEVLTWLAQAYISAQETGRAASTLEKLLSTPGGAMQLKPFLDLARLRLMSGDVDGATQLLDRVAQYQPDNVEVMLLKSQATIQAAKTPAEQKAAIDKALASLKPLAGGDDRRVILQLATLNERAGQLSQAISVLDEYLKKHGDDVAVLQQVVRLEVQNGQKDAALKRLEAAVAADPGNKVLGLLHSSMKGDANIGDQVKELIEQQDDPLSKQLALWQYYQRNNKEAEAAAALAAAAKIAPDDERVLTIQFEHAVGKKDWSAAGAIVDRVRKLNGGQGLDYAGGAFWQGRLELAQNNVQAAITVLDRGLKQMPSDSQGWLMMGSAQLATGDSTSAERSLLKSIEIKPENPMAWRQLHLLHDQQGKYELALEELRKAVTYSRGDNDLTMQYISYMGQHGDIQQAIATRQQIAAAQPDNAENQRALAELYLRAGEKDKCKAILDQLMAKAPNDRANLSSMAVFLASEGKYDAGLALIRDYVHQLGDKAASHDWLIFARYLRGGNQVDPAIAAYKQSLGKETDEAMPVRREYADWLFAIQKFEESAEQYSKVLTATGDVTSANQKLLVWRRYIETLMNARKLDEARAELTKLTKAYPNDAHAQMLTGLYCERRLAEPELTDAAKKQLTDEANLAYDRAVSLAPNLAIAYIQRARFRMDRTDEMVQTQVRDDLNRAVELESNNIMSRQLLVQWNLNRNNMAGAVTELNRLIQVAPMYPAARAQLAELYLNDGTSMPALARLLDDSIQKMPQVPAWHQYRARMYQMQQQLDPAEKELAKAYELDKTVGRMAEYASLLLRRGKDQLALDLLRQWPNELTGSPLLQAMRGQALYRLKHTDEAMVAFNTALDMAGKDTRQYGLVLPQIMAVMDGQKLLDMLAPRVAEDSSGAVALVAARIRMEMGQTTEAIKPLEALAGKFGSNDPQEVDRQRMLARAYYEARQFAKSRSAYEFVIEKVPQDLMALNNLAFMLADDLHDPQAALPLAQRAVVIAGNNPLQRANVLDTLGWVQYCAKDLRSAEETLRRSVSLNSMPVNNIHLARVYVAQERLNEARQVLMQGRALAETQKDTQSLQQIDDLLKSLAKPAASAER